MDEKSEASRGGFGRRQARFNGETVRYGRLQAWLNKECTMMTEGVDGLGDVHM